MPDIFDQVAAPPPPPETRDIFDQVAAAPKSDIFDQVAPGPNAVQAAVAARKPTADLAAASSDELARATRAQGYQAVWPPPVPTMQRPAPAIPPAPLPPGLEDENLEPPPQRATVGEHLRSALATGVASVLRSGAAPNAWGASDVAQGVEKLAKPAASAVADIGRTQLAGMGRKQPGEPALTPEQINQAAAGGSQVLGGVVKLATPAMLASGAYAPLAATKALAQATVAGFITKKTALKLGASPEVSGLLGDVAGLGAGSLSVKDSLAKADELAAKLGDALNQHDIPLAEREAFLGGQFQGEEFPVMADGRPHVVHLSHIGADGKTGYDVYDSASGKIVHSGSGPSVEAWLGQHANVHDVPGVYMEVRNPQGQVVHSETYTPDEAKFAQELVESQHPDYVIALKKVTRPSEPYRVVEPPSQQVTDVQAPTAPPLRTAQLRVTDPTTGEEAVLEVRDNAAGGVDVHEAGQPVATYPSIQAFHDHIAQVQAQAPHLQMAEVPPAPPVETPATPVEAPTVAENATVQPGVESPAVAQQGGTGEQASPQSQPQTPEGKAQTVKVIRWQSDPNEPEIGLAGATFYLADNGAARTNNPYDPTHTDQSSFGRKHRLEHSITLHNALDLPFEQKPFQTPRSLGPQIIERLSPLTADDVEGMSSYESNIPDLSEELGISVKALSAAIAQGRATGDISGVLDAIAVELLKRDGYDGAIQHSDDPSHPLEVIHVPRPKPSPRQNGGTPSLSATPTKGGPPSAADQGQQPGLEVIPTSSPAVSPESAGATPNPLQVAAQKAQAQGRHHGQAHAHGHAAA